ncbi:MAG: FkbM family methyltransferase [Ignavibacteriae bacterium]|nr:FkbM family methyltransferase [Ignavibacteriota bacterium]
MNKVNNKKKIDLFIDIGVNIGQSFIKIKSIDRDVEYIGFEPSIACISYVHKLRKVNNLDKVTLFPIGLSDSIGMLKLRAYGDSDTRASLSIDQINDNQATFTTIVPVFNLDYIIKPFEKEKLVVLKIDVEGYEFNVLKGGIELIKGAKPIILFEVLPHHNNENKIKRSTEIYEFLTSLNYTVYHLDQNRSQINKVQSLTYNPSNYQMTDFIAINSYFDNELLDNLITA